MSESEKHSTADSIPKYTPTTATVDKREPNQADGENPLSGFDLRTTEKTKKAGHKIVDELMELDEKYPEAAKAKDESNGQVEAFLEVVDFSSVPKTDRLARKRVKWLHEAMDAWISFILNTGMGRDRDVFEVTERLNIDVADED